MEIKAVLFDLDGTLLDTARDFIAIAQKMRSQRQLAPVADDLIRQQASSGARAMVKTALELDDDSPQLSQATEEFLRHYRSSCARYTRPFDGINQLLEQLEHQQIRWGIATNKPLHFTELILQQLGLLHRLSCMICPEHVSQSKPAPDMLLLACRQLGLEPHQAIYLGDDERDILAARQAGMPSLAVGYGYHPANSTPKSWGADFYIARAADLPDFFQSLTQN